MPADKSTEKPETRKCGECLMNDVEIVALGPDGKCPRCGADYGPPAEQHRGSDVQA